MSIVLAWLLGCFVFWCLLRCFTRLRGGIAVGITIMAGSLPAWVLLLSVLGPFADGNVGLIGPALLLVLVGAAILALGFVVILLSVLFGAVKKKRSATDGAPPPERNDTGTD